MFEAIKSVLPAANGQGLQSGSLKGDLLNKSSGLLKNTPLPAALLAELRSNMGFETFHEMLRHMQELGYCQMHLRAARTGLQHYCYVTLPPEPTLPEPVAGSSAPSAHSAPRQQRQGRSGPGAAVAVTEPGPLIPALLTYLKLDSSHQMVGTCVLRARVTVMCNYSPMHACR